ncbi:ABC transporter transmembrane region domain-containing protein [Cardiosporidium cionae]|uniref:ABC transporter transmembrane region domain-containing protein n=1 Tax=Cardiosporidium cionae TaxID=476202 RepID=A0ABQ7J5T0_9APIC|nr:ABC transporter transmembrane region domain-containing protein [Cardiosporidium cionae]|eukprot:KAF8819365.1 ABC transporter transmembrane region domain-containing protein [Cardiosporidium cionae]
MLPLKMGLGRLPLRKFSPNLSTLSHPFFSLPLTSTIPSLFSFSTRHSIFYRAFPKIVTSAARLTRPLSRNAEALRNFPAITTLPCTYTKPQAAIRIFCTQIPPQRELAKAQETSSSRVSVNPAADSTKAKVKTTTEKPFEPTKYVASVGSPAPQSSVLGWLMHYIWPPGTRERTRVVLSVGFLILAKLATIQAPILLGHMVDAFSSAALLSPEFLFPAGLVIAYPLARICASAFGELRNALFASVSQYACRVISCNSFLSLHRMDVDFLLTNKSGELSAVIRRGMKSVTQLLNMMLFQVVPTLLEFGMVLYVMYLKVGTPLVAITSVTMFLYILFTLSITSKRTEIRRRMNQAEQAAAGLLQDSLTNAETIRYFTSEQDELNRYEKQQRIFEKENIKANESLAFLNFGQQALFNLGLLGCLYYTALQVTAGLVPIGNLVMVSSLLFQVCL